MFFRNLGKPVLKILRNGGATRAKGSGATSEPETEPGHKRAGLEECRSTETYECFGNFTYAPSGPLYFGVEPSPRRTGIRATVSGTPHC